MDWDSDVTWEDCVHPAYEALLIQANNIKLPHLVREYQLTNQNHVNPSSALHERMLASQQQVFYFYYKG